MHQFFSIRIQGGTYYKYYQNNLHIIIILIIEGHVQKDTWIHLTYLDLHLPQLITAENCWSGQEKDS